MTVALLLVVAAPVSAIADHSPSRLRYNELWVSRFDSGSNSDSVDGMAASPDGSRVFVTGYVHDDIELQSDIETIAYDAETGIPLWKQRWDGPGHEFDDPWAIGVSPDGAKVFVSGYSDWAILQGSSNVVLAVTGASQGPRGGDDIATVAYDTATGSRLWDARYDDQGNSSGTGGAAIAVSPDGSRVYVTGGAALGGDYIYATIAYDAATGTGLWLRTYGVPGGTFSGASALGLSPDGSTVFVTGWSDAGGFGHGIVFVTLAYRSDSGQQLWLAPYSGPEPTGEDVPKALGVSPDGSGSS